jgi:hypothetical protein
MTLGMDRVDWPEMEASGRNWTEDFSHENGQYLCSCVYCFKYFQGHKRRAVCKLCAVPNTGVK